MKILFHKNKHLMSLYQKSNQVLLELKYVKKGNDKYLVLQSGYPAKTPIPLLLIYINDMLFSLLSMISCVIQYFSEQE